MGTSLLEQIHPQLTSTQPASATDVEERHTVWTQVGEVRAHQFRIEDEISTSGLPCKAVGRGRLVG